MSDDAPPAMGHNKPSLEDMIFGDQVLSDPVTEGDILVLIASRLKRAHSDEISRLASRTSTLVANLERAPESLDDDQMASALDLIAAADQHSKEVSDVRDAIVSAAKSLLDDLTDMCKPADKALATVDKKLRPLLEAHVVAKIDAHNATLAPGESPMRSLTIRAPSGAKVTVTLDREVRIVDPAAVPRELCTPDPKLVDEALARDETVPGTEYVRTSNLRLTK